eukprot:m.284576 g.284576  ORF g.284576 m.284576 type:complete len:64 (-) comp15765_c3_seq1:1879-2070(-)
MKDAKANLFLHINEPHCTLGVSPLQSHSCKGVPGIHVRVACQYECVSLQGPVQVQLLCPESNR